MKAKKALQRVQSTVLSSLFLLCVVSLLVPPFPAQAADKGEQFSALGFSRSQDYTFGIVILDLKTNKKGKEEGVGQLIYAAKVKVDGRTVEVENYGVEPARLQGVRKLS